MVHINQVHKSEGCSWPPFPGILDIQLPWASAVGIFEGIGKKIAIRKLCGKINILFHPLHCPSKHVDNNGVK